MTQKGTTHNTQVSSSYSISINRKELLNENDEIIIRTKVLKSIQDIESANERAIESMLRGQDRPTQNHVAEILRTRH